MKVDVVTVKGVVDVTELGYIEVFRDALKEATDGVAEGVVPMHEKIDIHKYSVRHPRVEHRIVRRSGVVLGLDELVVVRRELEVEIKDFPDAAAVCMVEGS